MNTPNLVILEDYHGGDLSHARAAWTSTDRALTPEKRDRVPGLLMQLAHRELDDPEPQHTVPFEKSYLEFLVKAETASHIHMLKHRIAVSVNGESARYKEHIQDKWYVPSDWPEHMQADLDAYVEDGYRRYHWALQELVALGVPRKRAKESARFYLPYASQLWLDVSFNFLSFAKFQRLRNEDHAQQEIHWIAEEMRRLVQETGQFDASLKAFGLWRD